MTAILSGKTLALLVFREINKMGNEYAELQRDYEETYGSSQQQLEDKWEHQENQADMEYSDED